MGFEIAMNESLLNSSNLDRKINRKLLCFRFSSLMAFLLVTLFSVNPTDLFAQNLVPANKNKPNRNRKDKEEIPPPEDLTLQTRDGVLLKCTYFAAPAGDEATSGKNALPFILIHDWERDRRDVLAFGEYLQKLGCAVIAPDLRGHGESTSMNGSTATIDYTKLKKSDFASVLLDIERCKKYLVQRNNEEQLNIDLLTVLAIGKSCTFAVDWTISDWSWPAQGTIKQGQDVKCVILVAPTKKHETLSLNKSLKNRLFTNKTGDSLPTMVVWSMNDESANDSQWVFEYMKKGRPNVEEIDDPKERWKRTTLLQGEIPGRAMSGAEMMQANKVKGLWDYIARFVGDKVGGRREDFRWQSRKRE